MVQARAAKNQVTVRREGLISTDDSRVLAYAIPTDEELFIARDTVRVILGEPRTPLATEGRERLSGPWKNWGDLRFPAPPFRKSGERGGRHVV
jgi:hypothetical protein